MSYKIKNFNQKINVLIVFYLFTLHFSIKSQAKEKISFNSANPFAMSDVIYNLQNQEKQIVFGQLTVPTDSLKNNEKYPLIIGVAGSLGWRKHHYDYMKMYQENGDVLMNYLQLPMSSPTMQKIGFLFCVKRGVKLGGNEIYRKKAFKFANSFMNETLK